MDRQAWYPQETIYKRKGFILAQCFQRVSIHHGREGMSGTVQFMVAGGMCGGGCLPGGRARSREYNRTRFWIQHLEACLQQVAPPLLKEHHQLEKHPKQPVGSISDSNHNTFFFLLMKQTTSDINQPIDTYSEPFLISIQCYRSVREETCHVDPVK